MADIFASSKPGLSSPASRALAVTPSDTTDLVAAARSLYVGGAGNIALITTDGDHVTFVGLTAGSILPVRTARVKSTLTTATSIVALL